MTQRFGPWDDALNRELLDKIKEIVAEYRSDDGGYIFAEDALDAIAASINETEGTDL
jgi:hypothetical protein